MRFRFRLEALWRHRRGREKAIHLKLVSLRAREALLEQQRDALRQKWCEVLTSGGTEAWLLRGAQEALVRNREVRNEVHGAITAQLEEMAAARREREALERLRERSWRNFLRRRRRMEGYRLDEMGMQRNYRRRDERTY